MCPISVLGCFLGSGPGPSTDEISPWWTDHSRRRLEAFRQSFWLFRSKIGPKQRLISNRLKKSKFVSLSRFPKYKIRNCRFFFFFFFKKKSQRSNINVEFRIYPKLHLGKVRSTPRRTNLATRTLFQPTVEFLISKFIRNHISTTDRHHTNLPATRLHHPVAFTTNPFDPRSLPHRSKG